MRRSRCSANVRPTPSERSLLIIRPTVVFGEQNRGNVYNLLRQIASGHFVMVGADHNRKSMACVENVAAFIEHGLTLGMGVHVYNYIDKPDFTMNALVARVSGLLRRPQKNRLRLPYTLGYLIGKCFDLLPLLRGEPFTISSIRVKKFCSNSVHQDSHRADRLHTAGSAHRSPRQHSALRIRRVA